MTSGAACKAVCVLMSESGNNVLGHLTISQSDVNQPVKITGNLTGLTPGKHGLSVCVAGDLSQGASTCGPIFNPFGMYRSILYRILASLVDTGGSLFFVW
jgi:Cu/Zn superoxide dismutase